MALVVLAIICALPLALAEEDLCPPHDHVTFHWLDYSVLAAMLIISCLIGTFVAYFGSKQETSTDFLLGGSSMGTLPMAMSLSAGFITAIELLGNPAEIYVYGSQYWLICIPFILVIPITSQLYLPVFVKLQLTSSYEYLELRFNKHVRVLAAVLYGLQMALYTSVAVYAPALALSHVTGLNVYVAVTLVYLVCIFYSSQGGLKAVIMTDLFQVVVLIFSLLIILFMGNSFVGGTKRVIDLSLETQRIEPIEFNPSPTVRHSIWTVVIGGTVYWVTMFCANQFAIQKYLSVSSIDQARRALWFSSISLILIFSINFYTGMIIYAEYHNCDPLKNQIVSTSDELLPLFVMNTIGNYKGVPGLFVSGIFAASLGTVASAVNSMAAITIKDFLGCLCGINVPENKGASLSKWISIVVGIVSFCLVFVVERLGSVLQVALSFNGMAGGIILGLFSLGMFFPWANSKGALFGAYLGLATIAWIGIGTQIAVANGYQAAEPKFTSTDGCVCNSTEPLVESIVAKDEVFILYRISYLWYSAFGFLITVVTGLAFSLLTKPQDPCRLHPDLISPPVHSLLQSLSNQMKETLGLPVESKDRVETKESTIQKNKLSSEVSLTGGIVNPALVMDNESVAT